MARRCAPSIPGQAIQRVEQVKGLGPFAAELVVVSQRRL
jgi:hypothetical protein